MYKFYVTTSYKTRLHDHNVYHNRKTHLSQRVCALIMFNHFFL